MPNTWFIGDTHFYHKNIIEYENRPFNSVEEMNEALIKNWNNKFGKQDRVFMLGDFTFNPKKHTKELCDRLNGYKILVMGNHDTVNPNFYMTNGFSWVSKYPIIIDDFFILSHAPMYVNINMPYANAFAHVHGNPAFTDYTNQTICVSIERKHMNYGPISYDEVKRLMDIKE